MSINIKIDDIMNSYIDPISAEAVKNISTISTTFTEVTIFNEATELSKIKEVTRKDVKSKHFIDWFFKLENWIDSTPKTFPYSMITHSANGYVYGYFNDDKLDGIIRVDECSDRCDISFFCINKSSQQQGIGQYLFKYILNKFRDKILILYVYTDNSPAIHIYEKYGFKKMEVVDGAGYYPDKSAYMMKKDPEPVR